MSIAIPQPTTGIKASSKVTVALIILNIIAYAITTIDNGFIEISDKWLYQGAFIPVLLPNLREWYRIFLSMFLHANLFHIFFNMLYLYNFGRSVESVVGSKRYLLLYILSGIVAEIFHTAFIPLEGPLSAITPAIGASGAISGVLGAYLLLFPGSRITMYFFYFYFPIAFTWRAAAYLIFWFITQILQGYMGGSLGVAVFAHAGGFIGGLALLPYVMDKSRHRIVRMLTASRRYLYYVYFGRRGLGAFSKLILTLAILSVILGSAYSAYTAKGMITNIRVLEFRVYYKLYSRDGLLYDTGFDEEPVIIKLNKGYASLAMPISSSGVRIVFNRLNALGLLHKEGIFSKEVILNGSYKVQIKGYKLNVALKLRASYEKVGFLTYAKGNMRTEVLSCLGPRCIIWGEGDYDFEIRTIYGSGKESERLKNVIMMLALSSLFFSLLALSNILKRAEELAIVI